MTENKPKPCRRSRIGRPPKHGGYSLICRDDLVKENPHLKRYLQDARDGLVRDVAGAEDQLTEQQRIMIDRIISRLSVCRMIEVYCEKYGLFRRDRLNRQKVLELEPALGLNYLAFSNSIDRALVNLGLNKKQASEALDLGRYIQQFDEQKARGKAGGQGKKPEKAGGKGSRARVIDGGQAQDEGSEAKLSREGERQGGGN